jgi:hypothetical protein
MVTSNHVYADELTVHGEHDVKTWMQQDLKTVCDIIVFQLL